MAEEEISEGGLKFGYWYASHRQSLKKWLIIFLIGLNLIFYGYSLYKVIDLYVLQADSYQRQLQTLPLDLVNYRSFRAKDQPQSLQIIGISVLSTGQRTYDLLARVRNPNPKWQAEFDYQFFAQGLETKTYQGFLLPGDEKFLVDFALASDRGIVQPRLEFRNLKWKKILQFEQVKADQINFLTENIKFIPARATELGEAVAVSQTTFDVTNLSPYNYWQAGFYIVLFSGNRAVGINFISLDQFLSGDKRSVTVNWFETLPAITKIEV
ncbi:MAG TPA: hypothetical protein VGA49_00005, partial [Patescibacteria group bacterium]